MYGRSKSGAGDRRRAIGLFSITVAASVMLSGCAGFARPGVRAALVDAGARPSVADCMAERMTDRLSIAQLRKLKRMRPSRGEKTSNLSAAELIERVDRIRDPEVVAVTASAGVACSLAG